MLYDIDNEKQELEQIEERNKMHFRKKTIICGIIILCCFFVMVISIWISCKNKNSEKAVRNAAKNGCFESI